MVMFYLLVVMVLVITALIIGFKAGRLSIADECLTKGFFAVSGVEYECTWVSKQDQSEYGLPDVLRDDQDNGAFSENTLEKLKCLKPKDKYDLKYKNDLFGEIKHHDCVMCCRDSGDIPRVMILCPTCGNKRCPKALNHRMVCTRSNEPDQIGVLDQSSKNHNSDDILFFDSSKVD
ncbi:hypothetical protein D3C78_896790 [compost metagenome]